MFLSRAKSEIISRISACVYQTAHSRTSVHRGMHLLDKAFYQLSQLVKPHMSMLGHCFLAELFVGGDVFRE